jgi:4-amino-4-deoxy-L-arabinose transferase-like glycosyltransferase
MATTTQRSDTASPPIPESLEKGRDSWLRSKWPELAIVAATFIALAWGLSKNGYGNEYYAAAMRSMTYSWRNFLFGAVDPGGWITTDKPPLTLWLGAFSARLFGYSSWSLLLPSAASGAVAVWLLMSALRRAWGPWAGRTAGIVLALTPTFVAVSRVNSPDVTVMLFMVAAAYATQRAISEERSRWMIVAGLCCGLAFLAKLFIAGFVMPGMFAAYLLAGPGGWWRRIRDVVGAGSVFAFIVAAWIALIDFTPALSRPYVALSTNNTAQSLVFGARGFSDLSGNPGLGAGIGGHFNTSAITARLPGLGGTPGIGRLFSETIGDQVIWLVIPAVLALLGGLVLVVRRRLTRPETGSVVLWGGYALVSYFVLAYTRGIFHDYYVSALAPALSALVGIGVVLARRNGRVAEACVLLAFVGTAGVEVVLVSRVAVYPALQYLVPTALGAVAAVLLVGGMVLRLWSARSAVSVAIVVGLAVALLAPGLWALWGIRHAENAPYASAGPPLKSAQRGSSSIVGSLGGLGSASSGLPNAELRWLLQHNHHALWIVAVHSNITADGPIIAGYSVMPWGGFYGSDPAMTRDRLASLVEDGKLRFVDIGGFSLGDPGQIAQLVTQACVHVNGSSWASSGTSTLYDCQGRASVIRESKLNPASEAGPGGFRLGPAAAVERLVACFHAHHWYPTANSANPSSPAAAQALRACVALLPAAVPGIP